MIHYTEESIETLDWKDHIRTRPGMYVGKLGDGSHLDDGIYILAKEIIDNAIDEHLMGFGQKIRITTTDHTITIQDFGRGIPLGKLIDCVATMNTGAKYHSSSFQKSVGLNGVGTKAVNALCESFVIQSVRNGKTKRAEFSRGTLLKSSTIISTSQRSGTTVQFRPDKLIFGNYEMIKSHLIALIRNYTYLNVGLKIIYNGEVFRSQRGLADHLEGQLEETQIHYPICHFRTENWEVAFTHTTLSSDSITSFVNGQLTPMGGTHVQAFRETITKVIRSFTKQKFESADIKQGLRVSLCIRMQEPLFESQTKTKLGSTHINGTTIRLWLYESLAPIIELHFHQHPELFRALEEKIKHNKKSRIALLGAKKAAASSLKFSGKYNKKLRDCKIHHYPYVEDSDHTMIFITEGDSASGSITKSRDPRYQAVFSLRGKPLNTFNLDKTAVYQNEELHLLAHALRLEDARDQGVERVRYRKIIIATDADVDGMHIRLLLLTFFLNFYPEVVHAGFVYVLETPLFRLRDKNMTVYLYSELQKQESLAQSSKTAEVTRFKGLGEISPSEFRNFIGPQMKLSAVSTASVENLIPNTLRFYMGGNTPQKRQFILDRLRLSTHQ